MAAIEFSATTAFNVNLHVSGGSPSLDCQVHVDLQLHFEAISPRIEIDARRWKNGAYKHFHILGTWSSSAYGNPDSDTLPSALLESAGLFGTDYIALMQVDHDGANTMTVRWYLNATLKRTATWNSVPFADFRAGIMEYGIDKILNVNPWNLPAGASSEVYIDDYNYTTVTGLNPSNNHSDIFSAPGPVDETYWERIITLAGDGSCADDQTTSRLRIIQAAVVGASYYYLRREDTFKPSGISLAGGGNQSGNPYRQTFGCYVDSGSNVFLFRRNVAGEAFDETDTGINADEASIERKEDGTLILGTVASNVITNYQSRNQGSSWQAV